MRAPFLWTDTYKVSQTPFGLANGIFPLDLLSKLEDPTLYFSRPAVLLESGFDREFTAMQRCRLADSFHHLARLEAAVSWRRP